MIAELLQRNLDALGYEKDEKEKEMLRIIIHGQVNREEKSLEILHPGTPPSDISEPESILGETIGETIPSRVEQMKKEDINYLWISKDDQKSHEINKVVCNVVFQMNGVLIMWPSGENDDEMKGHFNERDVQQRWREKWLSNVGHPLTEVRARYGDPWAEMRSRWLDGEEPSYLTGVYISL